MAITDMGDLGLMPREEGEYRINRNDVLSGAGIYMIECLRNRKIYIGRSKNMLMKIYEHEYKLIRGDHANMHMQNAFNKYGAESFVARTLEVLPEDDFLRHQERESYWAKHFDVFNGGFNIAPIIIGDKPPEFTLSRSGENSARAKLSNEDVIRICRLMNAQRVSLYAIAKMFGVTPRSIQNIRDGITWSHITDSILSPEVKAMRNEICDKSKLTEEDVLNVCELLNTGMISLTAIGDAYGVGAASVLNIRDGRTWSHIANKKLAPKIKNIRRQPSTRVHLTESDVHTICTLLQEGKESIRSIGRRFNVGHSTIQKIRDGKTWSHITGKQTSRSC